MSFFDVIPAPFDVIPGLTDTSDRRDLAMAALYKIPASAGMTLKFPRKKHG
jgi:hypothetical protein